MSGYALLPDFDRSAPHVQDYHTLLESRISDWPRTASELSKPYVPPAVVGWDASPRGANGHTLEEVAGIYPFTPIVEGSSSELFSKMLEEQHAFIQKNVPQDEQYIPITAWNEIAEGTSLLPKVCKDETLDNSFLEAVKKFKSKTTREQI